MTELLRKWAELEPAWCRVDDERAGVMTDVGTPLERPRFEAQFHRLGQYEPYIFASVIEAIEARGWEWTIWSDGAEREATVHVQDADPKQPRRNYGTDLTTVPTAATLLGAYLAALEAEGEEQA